MIQTLIVDDSVLVRSILRDFLESDGSFEIAGEARNGREGIEMAQLLNPDIITMDIEMPVMGGLEAIVELRKTMLSPVVVISTHDTARMAYEAVARGAMEFYTKDIFTGKMPPEKRKEILDTLKHLAGIKGRLPVKAAAGTGAAVPKARTIDAVVIGSSTGGPKALSQFVTLLPPDFGAPLILVQHNSSGFDRDFVHWLNSYTPLTVRLAAAGEIPVHGNMYVAPTDRHLVIKSGVFVLDDGALVNNQKPAVDVLFRSAAAFYGGALVSVVLTGMGSDGAEGTRAVHGAGGITIAQDEESSLIYGMPGSSVATGCVDMVLPLDKIPYRLSMLCRR